MHEDGWREGERERERERKERGRKKVRKKCTRCLFSSNDINYSTSGLYLYYYI
jgi:hypothetical protein